MINKEQSFSTENLLNNNSKLAKDGFQIDYLPMWNLLDRFDKTQKGGLQSMRAEEIWKRIYEFGIISTGLDKAEMQSRIEYLTEQNIKWHTKASDLEHELEQLKKRFQENQSTKES